MPRTIQTERLCALVTGGARNIGLAIARELASAGVNVGVLDICRNLRTLPYELASREEMEGALEGLSSLGTEVLGLFCDVRSPEGVEKAMGEFIGKFGRLDILVNNAGVSSLVPVTRMSVEAWDEVVDVCLKGTFLCCRAAIPHMMDRGGGRIINIASVAGVRGLGLSAHYCAAKHGVIGFTKALAAETADHHILVNAVCPGTVETGILPGLAAQAGVSGEPYAHFSRGHLLKDVRIRPSHIADLVKWLALEEKGAITGSVLPVDGGWTAL